MRQTCRRFQVVCPPPSFPAKWCVPPSSLGSVAGTVFEYEYEYRPPGRTEYEYEEA